MQQERTMKCKPQIVYKLLEAILSLQRPGKNTFTGGLVRDRNFKTHEKEGI